MSKFSQSVVQPFLDVLAMHAERTAFVIDGVNYSYGYFEQRILALLPEVTKSQSQVVGFYTHDHLDVYASIWAIWLAGKSYVPLNPNSPIDLNQRIERQLSLDIVLDASITEKHISSTGGRLADLVDLNSLEDDRVIYTLFTSGSTGVPKGVPITAGNLAQFVEGVWAMGYELTPEDRGLQMFELTFDLSVMSYLIPVLRGGSVYTIPKHSIKFAYVFELLTEHDLTIALMVPSMLNFLRPYFEEIDCPKMRYSLFCGEAMHLDVLKEWSKCVPHARIDNVYGPTENTIYCTYYTYLRDQENESQNGILSIGRSMVGNHCHVFTEALKPAKVGELGELCLAGNQLTPGYLNNEELNRNAFFEHINPETGLHERYYKTGDLCIQLENGCINYAGRKDTQVKIQGFRVELSEIEFQAKKGLQDLRNIVAIVSENNQGNSEITLMIEGESLAVSSLEEHLKGTLPWYMLPKTIIFRKNFPLNTNGKIDRKALKADLLKPPYVLRSAQLSDIDFIVEAITQAEKSNTSIFGLANILHQNEQETRGTLRKLLHEEIEGCEYSITDFVMIELHEEPVAALCAWVEGQNEDMQPSSVLKSNLFGYVLGPDKMMRLNAFKSQLDGIRLKRTAGAHQVEFVYVKEDHRGKGLIGRMLQFSWEKLNQSTHKTLTSEVEVFANNVNAIKAYEKLGYRQQTEAAGVESDYVGLFPFHKKIQMVKQLV